MSPIEVATLTATIEAQTAGFQASMRMVDATLKSVEKVVLELSACVKDLTASLNDVRLPASAVAATVAGAKTEKAALKDLEQQANDTSRAMEKVQLRSSLGTYLPKKLVWNGAAWEQRPSTAYAGGGPGAAMVPYNQPNYLTQNRVFGVPGRYAQADQPWMNIPVSRRHVGSFGMTPSEEAATAYLERKAMAAAGGAGKGGGGGPGLLQLLGWGGGGGIPVPWWLGGRFGGGRNRRLFPGMAGLGTVGGLAGFGAERALMSTLGVGGSLLGGIAGGGLLAGGALATTAVGMGTDMAGIGQAAGDIKSVSSDLGKLNDAIQQYGKHSRQAAQAQSNLNQTLKGFSPVARNAVLAAAQTSQQFKALFDKLTGPAEKVGAEILNQAMKVGEKFLPTIGKFAVQNMGIIQKQLQPFFSWLQNPGKQGGLGIFTDLEKIFQQRLPQSVHALTQAFELMMKVLDAAAKHTGGFITALDNFFTKWNSPAKWGKVQQIIDSLIHMFHVWLDFAKQVGGALYDLFKPTVGFGTQFIQMLTGIIAQMRRWLDLSGTQNALKTLFQAHLNQIKAFFSIFQALLPVLQTAILLFIKVEAIMSNIVGGALKLFADLLKGILGLPFVSKIAGWVLALVALRKSIMAVWTLLKADTLLGSLKLMFAEFGALIGVTTAETGALTGLAGAETVAAGGATGLAGAITGSLIPALSALAPFVAALGAAYGVYKLIASTTGVAHQQYTTDGKGHYYFMQPTRYGAVKTPITKAQYIKGVGGDPGGASTAFPTRGGGYSPGGPGRGGMGSASGMTTSNLRKMAAAAAAQYGVPEWVFLAQINQESGFSPYAHSKAGAIGIAQFMPATARGMGVDPTNPRSALPGAARMDAGLIKKYHGNVALALAAYNAGSGRVDQYLKQGRPLPAETTAYVNSILGSSPLSGGLYDTTYGTPTALTTGISDPTGQGRRMSPQARTRSRIDAATSAFLQASGADSTPREQLAAAKEYLAALEKIWAATKDTAKNQAVILQLTRDEKTAKNDILKAEKEIALAKKAQKEMGILGAGGQSATGASTASIRASVAQIRKELKDVVGLSTPDLQAAVHKVNRVLGMGIANSTVRGQVSSNLTAIKQTIADRLQVLKDAAMQGVQDATQQMTSDLGNLTAAADTLFTAATNARVTSMQKELTTHLQEMQIMVSSAAGNFLFGGSITETPAQQTLAAMQKAHDAQQQTLSLTSATQALIIANAGGNPQDIFNARQGVAEAQYAITVSGLQDQADVQQKAADEQLKAAQDSYQALQQAAIDNYQAQRDLQQQAMDQQLAEYVKDMEQYPADASIYLGKISDVFEKNGVPLKDAAVALGGKIYSGLAEALGPNGLINTDLDNLIAKLQVLAALPGGAAAVAKLSGQAPGLVGGGQSVATPGGVAAGSYYGVLSPFNPTQFGVPHLAGGGIVTKPTYALIGENGPEMVYPLSNGMGGGGVIQLTTTNNTYLDGRQISTEVRKQLIRLGRSNKTIFSGPGITA